MPEWRFKEMSPGDINIDPIESQFFSTETLGSITEALVRESIQNSLDATLPNKSALVRFILEEDVSSLISSKRRTFLHGLWNHIQASDAGLADVPHETDPLTCLVIEDFGTKGLQGDIHQYDDSEAKEQKNDFYYFWRNIGRGKKAGSERGRWGLGKTVFQAASRINSFFGYSVSESSNKQQLLMGQSVLKIHRHSGNRYAPYGYFGEFKGDLALPIRDIRWIQGFTPIHSITRQENQTGLSVIIPFPDRSITRESILQSVIRHYFFPILAKELVIELHQKDIKVINSETMGEYLKNINWKDREKWLGFLELAKWRIEQSNEPVIKLNIPVTDRAPKIEEDSFPTEILSKCRSQFNDGKRMAFHVPVMVKKKLSHPEQSHFDLFLEHDPTFQSANDLFIRNGITIPEVSSLKFKGVRAIVSITDPPLSAMLGDAENPAHTQWERLSKRLKIYEHGASTLDYIKTSPREIVRILAKPSDSRDTRILGKLFPKPKESTKSGEEIKTQAIPNDPRFSIWPLSSGFGISAKPHSLRLPDRIRIEVAYEVVRGNPFKKYSQFDFQLNEAPIIIEIERAIPVQIEGNKLVLKVEKADFIIKITGFDINRDLRVKVSEDRGETS